MSGLTKSLFHAGPQQRRWPFLTYVISVILARIHKQGRASVRFQLYQIWLGIAQDSRGTCYTTSKQMSLLSKYITFLQILYETVEYSFRFSETNSNKRLKGSSCFAMISRRFMYCSFAQTLTKLYKALTKHLKYAVDLKYAVATF